MSGSVPTAVREPDVLDPSQTALVRKHLEEVLASHAFIGSRRTQDFLRLIVGHALDGDGDSLRERMIGAEMFGRPVGYDTGSDSVVRVRASDVRKRLAQYYSESKDGNPPIRIELPSGSYVPRFHFEPTQDQTTTHADSSGSHSRPSQPHPKEGQNSAAAADPEQEGRFPRKRALRTAVFVIGAACCAIFLTAGYFELQKWQNAANARQGIRSIAVLPLENLSGDPGQAYFADGMTEELINDLGKVSTLRVISLTSSMSYKGTKKKLPEIAHELTVEGVVEGGVLREGNRVRISVQLIDARSDRPIWTQTYVRDLTDVMASQGDLAQTIAEEIRTEVTPQEQARLAGKRSIDPEAQDLYLHGVLLRNSENCQSAIGFFDRAIAKSPGYAQAHAALASCYGLLGENGHMNYQEAFSRQKAEALKAIELDDSLPEGHAELANAAMTMDWDWPTAEAQFHRALELNPNSASGRQKYAFYLIRTGHLHEALTEMQKGVDLDPVSGTSFHAEGFIYYFSREYDQALEVTRTVRGLKINISDWNFLLGDIDAEKGQYADSIAAFLNSGKGPYTLGHLGNVYARAGQPAKARELISRLEENVRVQGVGRYEIALIYAGLHEKKKAFEWLEDAYRAHDVGLVYLKVDPCLDPLRSDPHFEDLLHRVGLVQ
jgi:TolB-like protein/Tfp pilus assembly protein PilF